MAPHGTPHGCTTAVGFYQGCLYLVRGPAPTGFNPNAKTTIPEVKSSGRSRTVYLESKFLFHRKTLGLFGRHTLAIFLFYFIFPCLLLSSSFSFSYFLPRRNYSDAGSCSSLPPPRYARRVFIRRGVLPWPIRVNFCIPTLGALGSCCLLRMKNFYGESSVTSINAINNRIQG